MDISESATSEKYADNQIQETNKDAVVEEIDSVATNINPETKPATITSKNLQASPTKKQTTENNNKQAKTKTAARGRPKGNTNNKCAKKPVNDLDKYFRPQKNTPLPAKDVDLNVLNELPEELRQEIIKEYRLENKVAPPKSRAIFDEKPPDEASTSAPSAFDSMDWDDLKPIIINWLNSEKEPTDIDVTMIAEYLKQLAIDRKIETLKKMLSFLYRHVAKIGLCPWHEAYWTIINTVQEGMVARYGSTLHVERHFVCAVHF